MALLLAATVPASSPPTPQQYEASQIAQSGSLGLMLYTLDRAAWVTTDALLRKMPRERLTGAGGYVVELGETMALHVTYFRGTAANARAIYGADVVDGKVVRDELLADVPLTSRQTALAQAREVALAAVAAKGEAPCTPSPFNTVVMPTSGDRPIPVYILSAQKEAKSYPMGGHHRVIVGTDGAVLSSRPFSVACLNMEVPKLPKGSRPVGLFVNHLLDPVPTEIHVFASYTLGMPLFVGTQDKRLWQVMGKQIAAVPRKE
ncbi:MAG: hypothetical protein ABW184_01650 [Sphingobium sp.]